MRLSAWMSNNLDKITQRIDLKVCLIQFEFYGRVKQVLTIISLTYKNVSTCLNILSCADFYHV